jgi:hypothetical protein
LPALELRDALLSRIVVEIREHNHVIIERYEEILSRIRYMKHHTESVQSPHRVEGGTCALHTIHPRVVV